MKLQSLEAKFYRNLRNEKIDLQDLSLFIGKNASGKSTILDALRFLHEGVQERDFRSPVFSRGGIVHLAWKGEEARQIHLTLNIKDEDTVFEWSVKLIRSGYEFSVKENVSEISPGKPPTSLLEAEDGVGWWWSAVKSGEKIFLKQGGTTCALAAASVDAAFPARGVAEFVTRWGFFDPNPFLLRRDWSNLDSSHFDPYGRNLAERLHHIKKTSPENFQKILTATRSVLGLPTNIETRESEERFYFVQTEPGLQFSVHQMGVSSGTLRMLALMTALFGETEANLIGIEEPENHVHPRALEAFAQYLLKAMDRVQILVTTHSSFLLDLLNRPESIYIVKNSGEHGAVVTREKNFEAVKVALEKSGFSLGEFYETMGFGG